jgi:guanosine-3',5'-bis(diphosphate) 3'-pyrophosphohydrolase
MNDLAELPFLAAAFAARRHKHQIRKDGQTPYVSHVFRVCLVVRHVFGFDDPRMLAAALLHDTIEDTATDYDDVADEFGTTVADWVAALTKEMRLPDEERETKYVSVLAAAPWQVKACKLADIYDNLGDSAGLDPKKRAKTVERSRRYLNALANPLPPEIAAAFALTEARLNHVAASL